MATKSMVDYAPAEISAVEQYEVKTFSLTLMTNFRKISFCYKKMFFIQLGRYLKEFHFTDVDFIFRFCII